MSQSRRMCRRISIHAPRTGSDGLLSSAQRRASNFNPRSPHGERPTSGNVGCMLIIFQSTLPARGATELRHNDGVTESMISIHAPRTGSDLHGSRRRNGASYFNPRSPHGERQINPATMNGSQGISIHAPRMGSDPPHWKKSERAPLFQSTLPARGATSRKEHENCGARISIHAPRTGSDYQEALDIATERLFQSTLPARGATRIGRKREDEGRYFNPRSPHGERHTGAKYSYYGCIISIHAPRTGSDVAAN